MGKRLRNTLLVLLGVQIVAGIVGPILAKRMSRGDEDSDEFQLAAILGGRRFESHAGHLRSGTVVAKLGGIDLDLRRATLDPAGATLDLRTTMGGVQVTVPEGWAVDVDSTVRSGGVDAKVTPREDLPLDAPALHIQASARMGGISVTTGR